MEKRELILITGGARSGKSRFAMNLASAAPQKIFLATAVAYDEEMKDRIEIHRKERDSSWETVEEPTEIAGFLKRHPSGVLIVDCLTLWLSNLMLQQFNDEQILQKIHILNHTILNRNAPTILVTNEVGMGIVPDNDLGRRFRDLSGMMNQRIATEADSVVFMVSGQPLYIKRKES